MASPRRSVASRVMLDVTTSSTLTTSSGPTLGRTARYRAVPSRGRCWLARRVGFEPTTNRLFPMHTSALCLHEPLSDDQNVLSGPIDGP